jgi:hypothetical protein
MPSPDLFEFIKGAMDVLIEVSEHDCRERGAHVCKTDSGRYFTPNICVGTECSLEKEEPSEELQIIADLHTHPCPERLKELPIGNSLDPSFEDLLSWFSQTKRGLEYGCIGNRTGTKCYRLNPEKWIKVVSTNLGRFVEDISEEIVELKYDDNK